LCLTRSSKNPFLPALNPWSCMWPFSNVNDTLTNSMQQISSWETDDHPAG
jgi:hypothetical protein